MSCDSLSPTTSQVTPSGTVTSTKVRSFSTTSLHPSTISHATLFGTFPPFLKLRIIPSTKSLVGLYRAFGSSGIVGRGMSSGWPARSSAHPPVAMRL